jgi:hypothetical protein
MNPHKCECTDCRCHEREFLTRCSGCGLLLCDYCAFEHHNTNAEDCEGNDDE